MTPPFVEAQMTHAVRILKTILLLAVLVVSFPAVAAADGPSDFFEGSEEMFVVFPTYAAMQEDGGLTIPLHAWVFEPETSSIKRALLIEIIEEALDVEETGEEDIFEARIRPFLYDNERGKEVVAVLGDQTFELGESPANGHVTATIDVPPELAMEHIVATPGRQTLTLKVQAVSTTLTLEVPVIGRNGISVISDIDDTIKDTNVLDEQAMVRNTFLEPFRGIDGMASAYKTLSGEGDVRFHYLSASPWQLYPFLESWMDEAGFPDGTFHLRQLRPSRPSSVKRFIGSSRTHKISSIEQLLEHMPERDFVLIGDSGEHDPEVYGTIAREHSDRIERIYIRKVDGADNSTERFDAAFEDVPSSVWTVFDSPESIDKSP